MSTPAFAEDFSGNFKNADLNATVSIEADAATNASYPYKLTIKDTQGNTTESGRLSSDGEIIESKYASFASRDGKNLEIFFDEGGNSWYVTYTLATE